MRDLFLSLLNSSITASWLVVAILILRPLFARTPRKLTCALWALVAIRLICPVTIESAFSMIPSAEPVKQEMIYQVTEAVLEGLPNAGDNTTHEDLAELQELNLAVQNNTSSSSRTDLLNIATLIWGLGMIGMVTYTIVGSIVMERRLSASICVKSNIYSCDYIDGPFIFGFFRPKMYLPSCLEAEEIPYVVAHEEAHLKRKDYLWKPLGFLLLSVYWFNPVMWIAYKVFCRDIELACDEQVIQNLDNSGKAAYSRTLLRYSGPGVLAVGPLAFGEKDVKHRIKNVLRYKKPTVWITCIGVLAIIIAAACFLTNPVGSNGNSTESNVVQEPPKNFLLVGQNINTSDKLQSADSIVLVTVNKGTQTLSLTTLPGNTYLELGSYSAENGMHIVGNQQLKMAYTLGYAWGSDSGSIDFLKQSIVNNYDVSIDGCFTIPADVFIAVADALNGIDVELNDTEVSQMIELGHLPNDQKAGMIHLDGTAALGYKYLKIPEEDGAEQITRQITVTRLMLEKCQRLSHEQLSELAATIIPLINTDVEEAQINQYITDVAPVFASLRIETYQCPDDNSGEYTSIDMYDSGEITVLIPDIEKCKQMLNKITLE